MNDEHMKGGEDRDFLAAEYVLGLLDLDARLQARRLVATDPEFAELVAGWEKRLESLADEYPETEPPAHIKAALEARLFPQDASKPAGLWNALGFWRPLAIVTSFLFLLSVGFGLWNGVFLPPPAGNLVVSLQAKDSPVSFVALYRPGSDAVNLSPVSGEAGTGKDFELWLVEGGNPPASLGVLPKTGIAKIKLPPDLARKFVPGATLAISLESAGGSPTGAPTGPIVAAGQARAI